MPYAIYAIFILVKHSTAKFEQFEHVLAATHRDRDLSNGAQFGKIA